METEHLTQMKNQLDEFKKHLEDFAVSHKKEISSNPVFRGKFLKMCKSIGVDPLSSNKGMWADILGTGDFYYELGVQVVNICIALKKFNGGYLEESECLNMLKSTRGSKTQEVGVKDLRKAIQSLQTLGNDFKIIKTGQKRVICSVAIELNDDHMKLLKVAEDNKGWLTYSRTAQLQPSYSDKSRFNRAIEKLLQDGLAWEDNTAI